MIKRKFPFHLATINTDNGSENIKHFQIYLQDENVIQFFSRSSTPTDNPRVERSHKTDDDEFYKKGGIKKTFKEQQQQANQRRDYIYNFIRPHQALGQRSPIEFYELWKKDKKQAIQIVENYQNYLKKKRKQLATSRKMKRKEQIQSLMKHIEKVTGYNNIDQNNQKVEQCEDFFKIFAPNLLNFTSSKC